MGNSKKKTNRILVNEAFYFTVPEDMKYTTRDVSFNKETVLYCISTETENGKKASFKDLNNSSTFLFINGSETIDLNFDCMEESYFEELSDSYYQSLKTSLSNVTKPITLKPDKNTVIYLSSAKVNDLCNFSFLMLLNRQGMYFGAIGIHGKDMNSAKTYVKNLLMTISANDDTRDEDDFTEIEEKQPVLQKYNSKLLTAKKPNKATEDLQINVRGDFSIKVPKGMYYSVNEDLIGGHRAFVCISDDKGAVGKVGDVSEPFGYNINLSVMKSGQYCPSFKSNLPPSYFLSNCSLMKNELNEGMPIKLYRAEKDLKIYYIYTSNEIIKQCGFLLFCSCGEIYFGQFFVNDYQISNAEFNRLLFDWLDSIKIEKLDFIGKENTFDFSKLKKPDEIFSDWYCENDTLNIIRALGFFSEDALFYNEYIYKNGHHSHGTVSINPEIEEISDELIVRSSKLLPELEKAIKYLEDTEALRIPVSRQTAKMKRFMHSHDITGTTLFEFAQWHMLFIYEDEEGYVVYLEKSIANCLSDYKKYVKSLLDAIRKYNGLDGSYKYRCVLFLNIESWNEESEKTDIFEDIGLSQLPDGVLGYSGGGNFCGMITADRAEEFIKETTIATNKANTKKSTNKDTKPIEKKEFVDNSKQEKENENAIKELCKSAKTEIRQTISSFTDDLNWFKERSTSKVYYDMDELAGEIRKSFELRDRYGRELEKIALNASNRAKAIVRSGLTDGCCDLMCAIFSTIETASSDDLSLDLGLNIAGFLKGDMGSHNYELSDDFFAEYDLWKNKKLDVYPQTFTNNVNKQSKRVNVNLNKPIASNKAISPNKASAKKFVFNDVDFEVTDDIKSLKSFISGFDKSWKSDLNDSNDSILGARPITRSNDTRIQKVKDNSTNVIKSYGKKLQEVIVKLDQIGEEYIQAGNNQKLKEISELIARAYDRLFIKTTVRIGIDTKDFKHIVNKKYTGIAEKWATIYKDLPAVKIKTLKKTIEEKEKSIENIKAELSIIKRKKTNLTKKNDTVSESFEKARNDFDSISAKLNDQKEIIQADAAKADAAATNYSEKLKFVEKEIAEAEAKLESFKIQSSNDITCTENALSSEKMKLSKLTQEKDALTSNMLIKKEKAEKAVLFKTHKQEEYADALQKSDEKNAEYMACLESVDSINQKIASLNRLSHETISAMQEEIKKLKDQKANFSNNYLEADKQNSKCKNKLESIDDKLEEANRTYYDAEKLFNDTKSALVKVEKELELKETAIIKLQGEVNEINKTIEILQNNEKTELS